MRDVYKHHIHITVSDMQTFTLTKGYQIVHVGMQGPSLFFWETHRTDETETEKVWVQVAPTGRKVAYEELVHWGTVQDGSLVWHVFGSAKE